MNTFTYTRTLDADPAALYELLKKQNLEYFRSFDASIHELKQGCHISRTFLTKTSAKEVPGRSVLRRLSPARLQLVHEFGRSRIIG